MGVTRLKKKDELNYRIGGEGQFCDECGHFVRNWQVRKLDGTPNKIDSRCEVMGLKNSRRYAVKPIYRCNAFDQLATDD